MYLRALIASAGLDALAGAWLFSSAFLFHHGVDYLFVNNMACGALTMVLAFGAFAHAWFAWLPGIIGAWVMMSPLILGFTDNVGIVNNVATGVAILLLALESHIVKTSAREHGVTED